VGMTKYEASPRSDKITITISISNKVVPLLTNDFFTKLIIAYF